MCNTCYLVAAVSTLCFVLTAALAYQRQKWEKPSYENASNLHNCLRLDITRTYTVVCTVLQDWPSCLTTPNTHKTALKVNLCTYY